MGAAESAPRVSGAVVGDHDDNASYCRVSPPRTHDRCRLPPKQRCAIPSRRGNCYTSATDLTVFDGTSPHSSAHECENDVPSEDCWGSPVLQSIISRLSPRKKNAISSFGSIDVSTGMAVNKVASSPSISNNNGTQGGYQLHYDLSERSDVSSASPTRVQDFPVPSSSSITRAKQLRCRPPFTDEYHQDNDSGDQNEEDSALPRRRLDFDRPQLPVIEQQHQVDPDDGLQDILHAASRYEAESNFAAAIASLEEFLHQVQSSARTSFASEHSKATALHKIGVLQWRSGRYFFSEHVLGDCIHTYQCLLNESTTLIDPEVHSQIALETANALVSLGRVYLSKGETTAAMLAYNQVVRHISSIPKSSSSSSAEVTPARIFAQASVGAGRVLASEGKLKAALKRHKRALKVQLGCHAADFLVAREEISQLPVQDARVPLKDIAETLTHLGRLYEQWNDVTRALECHTKALALYRSAPEPDDIDIGYASSNVGRTYLRMKRIAEAEKALKSAHQVFSRCLGRNHRNTADALLSLGQCYAQQRKHEKALDTFKQVLRAESAVSGEFLAVTYHSIACSYEATFRIYKALKYYQREVDVLRAQLPARDMNAARLLQYMAKIAMQAVNSNGEYTLLDKSADWIEESAEIYHNQEQTNDELIHVVSCIEEIRKRLKRTAQ